MTRTNEVEETRAMGNAVPATNAQPVYPHTMRLQRFLARAGMASRRGSEDLMTAGRVTVNGEVAGGWRLFTHPAYHDVVEAYVLSWDTQKLSQAALETLAVIAYHQPVTREVVKGIRGVNSDGVIASLVDKGLVRELGRDPQRGQAIIYGTTNAFLEKFGLRSTRDLPDLEQFAPDEQSRQFIRERLSGRSIQSTLEEQAEDLDEERELLGTDVAAVEDEDTLVIDETSEDMHDED